MISLWLGLRSLKKLERIVEHPPLSQYVQEIVSSPLRFEDHGILCPQNPRYDQRCQGLKETDRGIQKLHWDPMQDYHKEL